MATFSQKNYETLLVAKEGNVTTRALSINALANGEIGVFTKGGTKLTTVTAATAEEFVLAVGRGAN